MLCSFCVHSESLITDPNSCSQRAAMMQSLPSPRYSQLPVRTDVDAEYQNGSTADSNDSLLRFDDEEKAWSDISARDPGMAERRASRRESICSALTSIRSLLDTVLLLVILGLVMDRQWRKSPSFEIGGDITGFAPSSEQRVWHSVPVGLTDKPFSLAANQDFCARSHVHTRERIRVFYGAGPVEMAKHCPKSVL